MRGAKGWMAHAHTSLIHQNMLCCHYQLCQAIHVVDVGLSGWELLEWAKVDDF
jgi:hypothetical protein